MFKLKAKKWLKERGYDDKYVRAFASFLDKESKEKNNVCVVCGNKIRKASGIISKAEYLNKLEQPEEKEKLCGDKDCTFPNCQLEQPKEKELDYCCKKHKCFHYVGFADGRCVNCPLCCQPKKKEKL